MDENALTTGVVEINSNTLPENPGTVVLDNQFADIVFLHTLRFSQAASLASLAEEYVYFSHGILFTYFDWSHDPVADCVRDTGGKVNPFRVELPAPVFKFLDVKDANNNVVDDSWNRTILAVKKDEWPSLFSFLGSLSGFDPAKKMFHTVVFQNVLIADVLALNKKTVLPDKTPLVPCYVLAGTSNRRTAYFPPAQRGELWEPVPVLLRSPEPKIKKMAKELFAAYNSDRGTFSGTAGTSTLVESISPPLPVAGDVDERVVTEAKKTGGTDRELLETYLNDEDINRILMK